MAAEVKGLALRCFCRHRPLLAVCGRDAKTGEPFVHIRTYKNKQIHTDAVVTAGTVRIHCRECFRWMTVTIRQGVSTPDIRPEELPESVVI